MMSNEKKPVERIVSRRELLRLAGTAGIAILAGYAGSSSGAARIATHSVTPEGEIGPFFADDSASGFNRSNILANIDGSDPQTGIPLTLTVHVYDTENNNAPMPGVQVDIWHCNAYGVYSDEGVENTSGQTWLRGYQRTDSTGRVVFKTIVPGWYEGRTTHIHLRVHSKYSEASSSRDGSNTTQVFLPQAAIDTIEQNVAPYNTHGVNSMTNASDHVYTSETHAEMELTLAGDYKSGYAATAAIYLPITSE